MRLFLFQPFRRQSRLPGTAAATAADGSAVAAAAARRGRSDAGGARAGPVRDGRVGRHRALRSATRRRSNAGCYRRLQFPRHTRPSHATSARWRSRPTKYAFFPLELTCSAFLLLPFSLYVTYANRNP